MQRPSIHTALPRRRYQYGTFQVVLLGNIESNDPRQYHLIMAFVQEGAAQPTLYLTAEKSSRAEQERGRYRLRVITDGFEEVLDVSDKWQDEACFAEEALRIAANLLKLNDEVATKLS
jgi:hypothetical protein